MSIKRLTKEAQQILEADLDWASAEPDGDNLFLWNCTILGPAGSPYDDGCFNLVMTFPDNYPFKPPHVCFNTKVFHPSVKQDDGEICMEIINTAWKPTRGVLWILEILHSMLKEPDSGNSVEPTIAQMMLKEPEKFYEKAKAYTQMYAT